MTMPANAIPTRVRKPSSLRSALTCLLLSRLRPRLAVAVAGSGRRSQAALEVVEDEADGRLRPGNGRDSQIAVDDDEDAALERRRVQLGEWSVAGLVRDGERLGDQIARSVGKALPRGLVVDRRSDLGAARVED